MPRHMVRPASPGESRYYREKDLEAYLNDQFRKEHLPFIKFVPDNIPGMPDRMVLLPDGKVIWVEMKALHGKLSPIQELRHLQLEAAGQTVAVINTKTSAGEFVKKIKGHYTMWKKSSGGFT